MNWIGLDWIGLKASDFTLSADLEELEACLGSRYAVTSNCFFVHSYMTKSSVSLPVTCGVVVGPP